MKVVQLNSVVFHTKNLPAVRRFYVDVLGLKVGTYEKNGQTVPDESDTYVNFPIAGSLLCFEVEDGQAGLATIILNVESLPEAKQRLLIHGIPLQKDHPAFLKFQDIEGREIILEQPR